MLESQISHEDDDEEKPVLCPNCLKYGFEFKLGPKCLFKGDQPQPDHDQWLQCYQCGNIYPIYEAKYEQTLEGFAVPTDNPFDNGEEVLGIPKRGTEAGKRASEKKKRERNRLRHKDPEVDEALRRLGEENVRII